MPTATPTTIGRYRLRQLLGQGGMGSVYLAHDTLLDRQVALKVPAFGPADPAAARARFLTEARAAATVAHPNICPVYEVGEDSGILFLAMAYIEGRPLSAFINPARPFAPRAAARTVRALALALAEAHRRGVIHRDIKPENVMVTPGGVPILMDFGIARRTLSTDARLTGAGMLIGTPAYMAPEQVRSDADTQGPWTDTYSLGVLLYEMITGRLPFPGPGAAIFAQILTDAPPPPRSLCDGVDADMSALCLRALAKEPADRYPSMDDFADALKCYLRPGRPRHDSTRANAATIPPNVVLVEEVNGPTAVSGRSDTDRGSETLPGRGRSIYGVAPRVLKGAPRPRRASKRQLVPLWAWLVIGFALVAALSVVIGHALLKDDAEVAEQPLTIPTHLPVLPRPDPVPIPVPIPPPPLPEPPPVPPQPQPMPGDELVGIWQEDGGENYRAVWTIRREQGQWFITCVYTRGGMQIGGWTGRNFTYANEVLYFEKIPEPGPGLHPSHDDIHIRAEGAGLKFSCFYLKKSAEVTKGRLIPVPG